ncbi:hypothetical protein B5P19_09995 [Clavibacter sepedonicus]|uniref:Membrane protein n=2 Tax=Microbacteriaceae TaxID=85023 RepID=B0RDJ2_CLASE|nr:hypothetical protein B5P19_09995 [Clavibacter sepedonicus]OQJ54093.1 hypothetical protein B5P20_08180 [Clavibacter sepedonicus]CAQ03121.1 putative membrane protein [Clavibacter sepedonicus]
MDMDPTLALLLVALAAILTSGVLLCVGGLLSARERGMGRAQLFARPALPWTLAAIGAGAVSVLCCLPILLP